MLKRLLFAAALTLCFSASAQANGADGNKVMLLCSEKRLCDAFLSGVTAALLPLTAAAKCLPSGVRVGQARDVLFQYIKSNPTIRHHHITILFDDAMEKAFGCKLVFFSGMRCK